jgi:septum formation protein
MAEVRAQLLALRGRTHRLTSAISLVRDGREIWAGFETADLTLRTFSEAELDWVIHIEGRSLLACVGAYRLEGASICLFERIEGDYFNILGLPLLPLLAALRQHAPETLESAAP